MIRLVNVLLSTAFLVLLVSCGVGGTAAENYEKGKTLLTKGDKKGAYSQFKAAAGKDNGNAEYLWAAAQTAPDQNAAYLHTRDAWQNGAKSRGVLRTLVALSFHTEKSKKLEFALDLYSQLPDTAKSQDFLADLYCEHDATDTCLAIRQRLFDTSSEPQLAVKIAQVHMLKGEIDKAESFLRRCRTSKQLNGTGYVMLAGILALNYDFAGVNELFAEAKRLGHYSEPVKLEHGGFLVAQGKYEEAIATLADMAAPVKGDVERMGNIRARLLLSLIYFNQRQPDSIAKLKFAQYGDEEWRKVEHQFYDLAAQRLRDTATVLAQLRAIRAKMPQDPVVTLFYARESAREGAFDDAIEGYKELPPIMLRSPAIIGEYAFVLARAGKDDEALQVVSFLHAKKLFTRVTLELFRDLTFKKNLLDKSLAAQEMLESRYSGDAGVKWGSATLALKMGETDKALKIFSELATAYPKEPQFEVARISTFLVAGRYDEALAACDASTAPQGVIAPLKARIYRKTGKDDLARSAYAAAVKARPEAPVLFEYAEYLIEKGSFAEAGALYRDIGAMQDPGKGVDTAMQAMLQNNLAWSLMQQPGSDPKAVLTAAENAYRLKPDNVHIVDTYADALNQYGKHRDAIKLLEGNTVASAQPRLVYHLAVAYDKNNEINKAVRTYQQVLAMPVKEGVVALPVSTGKIEGRIAELVGR